MAKIFFTPRRLSRGETGVTSIEYALIGTLIAIIAVVTIMGIPVPLNIWFGAIAECLAHPTTCGSP